MYQTINKTQFRDAFRAAGRADQFSYDALSMLFDYLDDDGYELDVIAICCAFSEDEPRHIADHDIDVRGMDDEQTLDAVLDYLGEKTQVIGVTDAGTVVYNSEF